MLTQQVLAAIAESPGISAKTLAARFPGVPRRQLQIAIQELRTSGRVETPAHGHYQLPQRRAPAGVGQTAPMHRLMAGR